MRIARKTALVLAATALLALGLVSGTPTAGAVPPDGTMLTLAWETGELFTIDPSDASTTAVGTSSLISSTAIAWDATSQTMFGVDYDFEPASLYTVDPDTAASSAIGSMDLDEPTGLDAQPGSGVLYMVYDNPDDAGSILATVDPATAAVTDIAPTLDGQEGIRLSGIAFDPTDGALYGLSYDDGLYEIDPATGTLTLLFAEVVNAYGLAFDCGGQLYAADDDLWTIDLGTGTATQVGLLDLGQDFTENLTVICAGAQPTTTTTTAAPTSTTAAPAPVPVVTPARAVAATPRFTG
jgi:hypothetical protein